MREEFKMVTCRDCGDRQATRGRGLVLSWIIRTHCRKCGCPLDYGADERVLARVDWIAIDPEQVAAREALSQVNTFSNMGMLIKENPKSI